MTDRLRDNLLRAAEEVVQVDLLDRVRRGSRRASRRRAALIAAAACAAVAMVALALPLGRAPVPADPSYTASPSHSGEPLPIPDPSPRAAGPWSNEADPAPSTALDGQYLVVPEVPGADPARSCAGSTVLRQGAYRPPGGEFRQLRLLKAVADGDGVFALFYCYLGTPGRQFQVVRYDPDRRLSGVVIVSSPELPALFDIAVVGDEVRVEVGDWAETLTVNEAAHFSVRQWRAYGWTGRSFTQVGGPVAFAPNPNFHDIQITAADLALRVDHGSVTGKTTITVRNAGAAATPFTTVRVELPVAVSLPPGGGSRCPSGPWTSEVLGIRTTLTCEVGPLPGGASAVLVIDVAVDANATVPPETGLAYTIIADSTSNRGDWNRLDNNARFKIGIA